MGAQPPPSHLPPTHHHHQSISLGPAAPLPQPPSSNGAPPTPSGPPGSSVAQATPKLPPTPSAGPPYTNGPGGPGPGGPGQGPGQEGANGATGESPCIFSLIGYVLFCRHELLTNSPSLLFSLTHAPTPFRRSDAPQARSRTHLRPPRPRPPRPSKAAPDRSRHCNSNKRRQAPLAGTLFRPCLST